MFSPVSAKNRRERIANCHRHFIFINARTNENRRGRAIWCRRKMPRSKITLRRMKWNWSKSGIETTRLEDAEPFDADDKRSSFAVATIVPASATSTFGIRFKKS